MEAKKRQRKGHRSEEFIPSIRVGKENKELLKSYYSKKGLNLTAGIRSDLFSMIKNKISKSEK